MKGLFYSIMIALFIVPFLAMIMFYSQTEAIQNIDINIRSEELQYFSDSIEKDLIRFLQINGKRALISASSEVVTNGIGLRDASANLTEMLEYGTLDGNPAPLVDEKNFMTWKENISNIAANSGFNILFINNTTMVTQNDSFSVLFSFSIYVNISDEIAGMFILKNISVDVPVSLEGIEDPIYQLKTYGGVSRIISISPFNKKTTPLVAGQNASGYATGYAFNKSASALVSGDANASRILVTDDLTAAGPTKISIAASFAGVVSENDIKIPDELMGKSITGATNAMKLIKNETKIYLDSTTKKVWDLSNITSDIKNGYYHGSNKSASFLDRLEGNVTLSVKYQPYGLESFVYTPYLTSPNLQSSVLDYQYWTDVSGNLLRNGNLQSYDYVYSWFRISNLAENDYGINDLIG